MKQARMLAPHRIAIEEVDVPRVTAGHVLLKINAIGVCGSDIHVYHGKHPYTSYPVIQGHELSATVAEVGAGVQGLTPGQLVTVEPSLTCGECYPCRHGRYNICDHLKVMGFQTDGAAREYFLVPATHVVPLPSGFSPEIGAMIEPLAVAVHAVRRLGEIKGGRILVLGAGPIGNLTAQTVKAFGAVEVAITDLNPFRLGLAAACGLNKAINIGDASGMEELRRFLDAGGPDGILECVGAEATMEQAITTARKGSRIVVVGVFGEKPRVDMGLVQDRELELIGTLMYRREDYVQAIELVQRGAVNLERLITHRFALADYAKAYETIDRQPETVMKVLIEVGA